MEVAKISSKGQITIPVSVRNALKLKAGDCHDGGISGTILRT